MVFWQMGERVKMSFLSKICHDGDSRNFVCLSIFFVLNFIHFQQYSIAQTNPINLSWELKHEFFFKHVMVGKNVDAGSFQKPKKGEKKIRYIMETGYNQFSQPDFEKYSRSWEVFYKSVDTSGLTSQNLRKKYSEFLEGYDRYLKIRIHVLGPQLAFTFTSNSTDSVFLQTITIKTLEFSSYPGGGFCGESEWNDIVLSHKKGLKEYNFQNQFTFSKSGTLDLRFYTDYFFRDSGWAPLGNYLIQIQFNFLRNGKKESVSTEVFKIDA